MKHSIRLVIFGVALLASSTLFSFVVADRLAEDIWKRLGITRQEATDKISKSFIEGYLQYYGVKGVKNLAVNDRTAVAKDLMTFARQYLGTPTFKAEYDKVRAMYKPVAPVDNTPTKEQVRQKEISSMKEAIQNMEKVAKTLPADQQKDFKSSITMYQDKIKEYQDPNNKMIEMIWQGKVDESKREADRYKDAVKKWEMNYPADAKAFVRGRLQHYLDVAKTVDFSAALVEKGGKQRFVNPTYQGKNNEWKMIFRAGKDVYDETKPFVEQWLKEL
jgi:hypothetical protein